MKDIRARLTDADPLRREAGLSDAEAARMRTVVLSSAGTGARTAGVFLPGVLAVAAVLILMVVAGTFGRRLPTREVSIPSGAAISDSERRQLQFATPGGTRIIWTLDPQFKLEGVVP